MPETGVEVSDGENFQYQYHYRGNPLEPLPTFQENFQMKQRLSHCPQLEEEQEHYELREEHWGIKVNNKTHIACEEGDELAEHLSGKKTREYLPSTDNQLPVFEEGSIELDKNIQCENKN